ncbi:MAG: hypothetical protein Q4A32_06055 [Lachnospiraceae bacterium]|nr:hypothetical protein [Lachnospiraceae bacterium]
MKKRRKVLGFMFALAIAIGLMPGMSLTAWAADVSGNNNLPGNVSVVNVVGDTTHTGNWGPKSSNGVAIDLRGKSLTIVNGSIGINPGSYWDGDGCGKITLNDSTGGGRFIINNADVCGLYMYNGTSSVPSEFEMNGGTYTYTSSRDNPNYTFAIRGYWGNNETGGGNGLARINGGTITDCSGYAVSTLDSGLYIGGRVFITGNHGGPNGNGNVFVKTGRTINITGDLQDSVIGITTETLPTPGNPVVLTNGLSGLGSARNFISDNPDYEIRANEDGEAVLVGHEHSFSYYELSAEGDAITAICDNSDGRCNLENYSALLKIEANEDGSVSFSGDTDAFNSLPEMRFYAADENGQRVGEMLNSAPVTGGKYWAEFTLGDYTAHTVYEVPSVASIGTVGYGTLQSAMDAAGNGDTIVLLEDVIQCVTFDKAENESVTLDLNGHRIDGNQEGTVITMPNTNTGTLILDDGSSDAAGVVTGGKTNGNGGGILLSGGTFVLKNGSIEGNTASGNGGGIQVDNNTTFNMEGGLIQGNIASNGGGVALAGAESFFNMSGGEISCNAGYGNTGGVLLDGGEPFHMSGGKIQYNAGKNFGGIGSANASIKVSGTAYVRDNAIFSDINASNALSKIKSGDDYQLAEGGTPCNVNQHGSGVIKVVDGLSRGASIGVSYTFSSVYNATNGAAFTTGYNDYNSSDKAGKYFSSDDTNYGIHKNDVGELKIAAPPSYIVTWKNWDGSVLLEEEVAPGETPVYNGEVPPVKSSDTQYDYTFTGWTPEVAAVTANAEYTATFSEEPHQHNFGTGDPRWRWSFVDGKCYADATYTCSCGEVKEAPATVDNGTVSSDNVLITYTATDEYGKTDSRDYFLTYIVKYNGTSKNYKYGDTCKLTADSLSDWIVNDVLLAEGTKTFYFPVTVDAEVTAEPSESETQKAKIIVQSWSSTTNSLTYVVSWSLPEGAQVKSTMIYRCRDDNHEITTAEELLAASNLRSYNMNLNVRNGQFTYKVSKMTTGSSQTIMAQIVYTLNGETYTINTAEPDGPQSIGIGVLNG